VTGVDHHLNRFARDLDDQLRTGAAGSAGGRQRAVYYSSCGICVDTPGREFIRLHMKMLVAFDLFTNSSPRASLRPWSGRSRCAGFFPRLETRRVFHCRPACQPAERGLAQQARNVRMRQQRRGALVSPCVQRDKASRRGTARRAEKKPPVGFEPTTCGLQNRCSAD
jgi:hypothetical protein